VKYLLDTHTWIWWHMQPGRLPEQVRQLIATPENYDELLVSAISAWEFAKLVEKGRLGISCETLCWLHEAIKMPKFRMVPLTLEVASCSTQLPAPFHSDPADQIIVATARLEQATLLTADERILAYPYCDTLW